MEELTELPRGNGEGTISDELAELRQRLANREQREQLALGRLRDALLAGDPAIDRALVTGETLEQIEASFAAAKAMADRIRENLQRERAAAIPAGGATRTSRAPQSAIEKIRAGLGDS